MAYNLDDMTANAEAELGINNKPDLKPIPIPSLPSQSAKAQPERKMTQTENSVAYDKAQIAKQNPPKKFESGLP